LNRAEQYTATRDIDCIESDLQKPERILDKTDSLRVPNVRVGASPITSAVALPPSADALSRRSMLTAGAAATLSFTCCRPASAATSSESSAARVLLGAQWEEEPPYTRDDFRRLDESDDSRFYDEPKLVYHIDEPAVKATTAFYGSLFKEVAQRRYGSEAAKLDVLDLCSSWVSHYPPTGALGRAAGLGMNAVELGKNPVLTEYVVRDLNKTPKLPYDDGAFDVVTCTVSIDYLTAPVQVMSEVARVLRPGGSVALLFSDRLFFSKAVALWTGKDDEDHIYTVGGYLHYGGRGRLGEPAARELRPKKKGQDPLYAVYASRV
jgi:SAM-dependent methyltransferase